MSVLLIVACSSKSNDDSKADDSSEGGETETGTETGGELKIAVSAQPPSLDAHISSSSASLDIGRMIFETLMTLNEDHQSVPMLAESIEESEDGKTYTFKLREGIKFHNGEEMIAEDVEASMNRWLENSPRALLLLDHANFEAKDKYVVELTLEKRVSDVLDIMAGQGQFAAIMPKEQIDTATPEGVSEIIGTGPFKYEDWRQDQYVHLVKYDDYQSRDEEPSGYAGRKEALVDDLYYYFVPDSSTRVAGLQTGEYDIAEQIPQDSYERLEEMDGVQTHVYYFGTLNMFYNKKEGVMSDPKMRQAVNIALNMDEIMLASYANENLFKVDHNYMNPDSVGWASDAGKDFYNQNDIEKAKELLAESGYNGEKVRLLTTRDYDDYYSAAVVVQEQLEQIGMNVDLEVFDLATLYDNRAEPDRWEMFFGGVGYNTSPSQLLAINPTYPGWTEDPRITELLAEMGASTSQEEAKQHWDELHEFLWAEYLPASILGHYTNIIAVSDKVENLTIFQATVPWNTRKAK